MSNRLYNLAQRVQRLGLPGNKIRNILPSEIAVLLALANDARDKDGGRSRLEPCEIGRRTGLSERSIRRALAALVAAGQISRARGALGEVSVTTVHPVTHPVFETAQPALAPLPPRHPSPATVAPGGCHGGTPLIENPESLTINQRTSAGARAQDFQGIGEEQKEAAAGTGPPPAADPVEQVFAEWDAMAARARLPGPVERDAARRLAIERRLGATKLWRVLAAVRAIERSDFLTGRRRATGQGDWRADFDYIFGVDHRGGMRTFAQLLEGKFTADPVPAEEPPPRSVFAATIEEAKTDRRPEPPPPEPTISPEERARLADSLTRLSRAMSMDVGEARTLAFANLTKGGP